MVDWLSTFLDTSSSFMPHGHCYLWLPTVMWMHVISDAIIVLAYYSIPFSLLYFCYKRTDLVHRWVFVLFGAFILLCGTTHLMSIWTIWHPDYWLEGSIKLLTALVSIVTAILIWPLIPKLLDLPSESALKASESYMRAIFDATPDAMLISNEQGIIVMVNHQSERLLGYSADELIGQSVEFLLPERLRTNHVWLRQQFMKNSNVRLMGDGRVVRARKKDATELDVEISLSPIQTERGLFFASSLRDITRRKQMEDALRASEELFRRMSNASPAMIWITDVNGKPTFVNQTWLDFTGLDFERAILYESWIQLIHPEYKYIVLDKYYKNVNDPKPITSEYRMRNAQGDWRWILDQGVPMYDEGGQFTGYIGSAFDITERKQSEAEFRIAATAFESQEAMVITDVNAVILRVNKAFTDSTGYSAAEAVGQSISILKSGRHDPVFYADMWRCLDSMGTWQGEIWDKRKNGQIYPKWLTITAVKDERGHVTHYVGTHIDISDRKAAEDEIKNLAFYDPLTKLPNRRLLRDRLNQSLATHARKQLFGALLFLDLDNFKNLNDTLGHDKGDQLLQQVAKRLKLCVRECDTVARLGGDEFVIMLEELNVKREDAAVQVEIIGGKILQVLNENYQFDGYEHHSTTSVGVTLFHNQALGIDEVLKQADIAMYQAKATGRNNLRFFDPNMQASIVARTLMEQAMHEAILAKEFTIFYQPQSDVTGRIKGVEALLRWDQPQQGMISPADFIPLAEETGMILELGRWVLETSCEQLVKWAVHQETAHLTIAVNVSVRQFRQENFADQVMGILAATGANPARLKLELTESLLALDIHDIIAKMTKLKAKGVAFSLDDFGTGYSSLSYLKKLPLDQLKIDQGFVRDILVDANDEAIARMIIALADSMGLEVIAEGVETQMQKDILQRMGCMNYQGYLISKPVPVEQFEALFTNS